MASKTVSLLLGDQLFALRHLSKFRQTPIFMAEDYMLCSRYAFHKHKIIFFLSAMRRYASTLKESGYSVNYLKMGNADREPRLLKMLEAFVKSHEADTLQCFEIEDAFFAKEVKSLTERLGIKLRELPSPMFIFEREYFKNYLQESNQKPFLRTFYERARRSKLILLDKAGGPIGGKWSFDSENRKRLPAKISPPAIPQTRLSEETREVSRLVEELFPHHPGECDSFWLPIDEAGAKRWLTCFLEERFKKFGDYQDAITSRSLFVYHSVLSPFLNCGLLTPDDVLSAALGYAQDNAVELHTLEGFVRQILGWREFLRGIYHNYTDKLESSNFFGHSAKLGDQWYSAQTGVELLDYSLSKSIQYAYAHHIERLMVLGNWMLLCRADPKEVYRWFMEMFIDSGDWVMAPNVYGMSQYSDGGLFATKPYICGANYFRKMGDFAKGGWEDIADGLYWSFIEDNKKFFSSQPRLSLMTKTLEKMDVNRKNKIFAAALEFRSRVMVEG